MVHLTCHWDLSLDDSHLRALDNCHSLSSAHDNFAHFLKFRNLFIEEFVRCVRVDRRKKKHSIQRFTRRTRAISVLQAMRPMREYIADQKGDDD